jgi:RND family efflux transporter MFP subunit
MPLKLKIAGIVVLIAIGTWLGLQMMRPVATVVAARRERAINAVPGSLTVLAERALQVKSEVGGRVIGSKLDLSAKVQTGGILIELDRTDTELQIEQLQHDRDAIQRRIKIGSATQFELLNARDQYDALERQSKVGTVTAVDVERQNRLVKQLEQKLELETVTNQQALARVETDLKVAERKRDLMTVRSPVDGIISAVFVNPGDLISSGEPVATIIADTRVIEAKISEENFSGLKIGQKATLRFLSYGAAQYPGRVEKILPAADPLTQRYMVHLSAEIDPKLLVPGITGEVNIIVDAREKAIVVPRRALLGRNVFVVKDGRVEIRTVEVGFTSLNAVEITRGVEEGDLVIVEDLDRFRASDRVSTNELKP